MDFAVFAKSQSFQEIPEHRATRTLVKLLISQGYARKVGQNAIQIQLHASWTELKRMARETSRAGSCDIASKQGAVYESAAIETRPLFHVGGMVRTEHKPAKFQSFKAARVMHQ